MKKYKNGEPITKEYREMTEDELFAVDVSSFSEKEKEELSFENIRQKGLQIFEDKDVFGLCSREVRETNYAEDRFLLHLCFEMFLRGQYDKVTLTYLANYYCGATADMKKLWKMAVGELSDDTLLVAVGSLYMVGEIKGFL